MSGAYAEVIMKIASVRDIRIIDAKLSEFLDQAVELTKDGSLRNEVDALEQEGKILLDRLINGADQQAVAQRTTHETAAIH
jgi:hypothetical protein